MREPICLPKHSTSNEIFFCLFSTPQKRDVATAIAMHSFLVIVMGMVLAVLTGCASAPIPTEQFAVSQAAIENATSAGAPEYAPLEIKSARDKMSAAQRAINDKDYTAAAALAEEAAVDAKLAETKAASEKANKSVNDIKDNLRTLIDEVERNSQQQIQSDQKSRSGSS